MVVLAVSLGWYTDHSEIHEHISSVSTGIHGETQVFLCHGPESSGSTLTARICLEVLLGVPFDSERAEEWEDDKGNRVWHVSLPSGPEAAFADVNQWVRDYSDTHDLHFILTTRDITLSEYSEAIHERGSYEVKRHSDRRDIMLQVMSMEYPQYTSPPTSR